MAAEAVEAVVSVVIQKLTDMLIEDPIAFDKVIDQVESIRIQLRRMRGFLMDAEKKQKAIEPVIKKWVDSYLDTLYKFEDIIETFVLRVSRGSSTNHEGCFSIFGTYTPDTLINELRTRKLRKEIKGIEEKIVKLNRDKPPLLNDLSFKLVVYTPRMAYMHRSPFASASGEFDGVIEEEEAESVASSPLRPRDSENGLDDYGNPNFRASSNIRIHSNGNGPSFRAWNDRNLSFQSMTSSFTEEGGLRCGKRKPIASYYVGESNAVGLEEDVERLVTQLMGGPGLRNQKLQIISIVGSEGSGKTTIARTIYNRRDIKLYFKHRAWIFVSSEHQNDTRGLLLSILKQVAKVKEQGYQTLDQLVSRLADFLRTQRYLLVMDDIRASEVWGILKGAFPDTNLGSRVMFSAREEETVAPHSDIIHRLRPLSDQYSLDLLADKVGFKSANCFSEIPELKDRILRICEGSPLAIVLLGGLLSTKKSEYDEWSNVLDGMESQKLDLLVFCYNDLPFHSKLCLLYLALFPKEFDVSVRRLFRLWLAEGFVKRSLGMSPEDLAEEYFNDLVYRNLIQLSRVRSDGTPKKCRMPGFVYDKLLCKAQDISLFHVHQDTGAAEEAVLPKFGVRRIVEYSDIKTCKLEDSPNIRFLRSYLSFNTQKKDTPAKEVGVFLGRIVRIKGFGLLRVLDLEGVYKPSLPDALGNLFHLRYLGLRWTFLDTLPESVGHLPYLETLDVKHTYINTIPSSVWNLKHLRHLNLNGIRLDMPEKHPNSSLSRLLTLWGLFVDKHSPIKNGLNRLSDLRELGITCQLDSVEDLANWIATLTSLQSLRLRSKDDTGRPSKLILKPLSDLKHLSHVYVLGHLEKLPYKLEFPPNLKVLTLSVSRLEEDPMPTLGQLPILGVLRLFASSYLGTKMICPLGGFTKLRTLKLWMLKNLEEWDVKEGAMLKLQKLEIRGCKRLKEFPSRLLQLGSLEDLILTAMPADFVNDVRHKLPQNISLIDNSDWKFTPLPWEEDELDR